MIIFSANSNFKEDLNLVESYCLFTEHEKLLIEKVFLFIDKKQFLQNLSSLSEILKELKELVDSNNTDAKKKQMFSLLLSLLLIIKFLLAELKNHSAKVVLEKMVMDFVAFLDFQNNMKKNDKQNMNKFLGLFIMNVIRYLKKMQKENNLNIPFILSGAVDDLLDWFSSFGDLEFQDFLDKAYKFAVLEEAEGASWKVRMFSKIIDNILSNEKKDGIDFLRKNWFLVFKLVFRALTGVLEEFHGKKEHLIKKKEAQDPKVEIEMLISKNKDYEKPMSQIEYLIRAVVEEFLSTNDVNFDKLTPSEKIESLIKNLLLIVIKEEKKRN